MTILKTYEGFLSNIFNRNKIDKEDLKDIFTYITDDSRIKNSLNKYVNFDSNQIDLYSIYPYNSDSIDFEASLFMHNLIYDNIYGNFFIYNNTTFFRIEYHRKEISDEEVIDLVEPTFNRLKSIGAKVSFYLDTDEHYKKDISLEKLKENLDKCSNDRVVNIYFKIKNVK